MIKYCKLFGKVRCRETNEKGVKSVCVCVLCIISLYKELLLSDDYSEPSFIQLMFVITLGFHAISLLKY